REYAQQNRAARSAATTRWKHAHRERVARGARLRAAENADHVRRARVVRTHRRRSALLGLRSAGVSVAEWRAILEVFGNRCAYCLRASSSLTRDHVEPISVGGADEPSNVVPACGRCNSSKGARSLLSFARRV